MNDRIKKILIRLQSVTQTDNVYLAKNFWYVGGSQVLAILNGFVIYLLIARLVPQGLFGEYRYLVSIFEISSVATLTGMKVALMSSVAKGYEGSLQFSFARRLRWGLVLGLPLVAGALWYWMNGNAGLALALLLIYVAGPLTNAGSGFQSFLQGKRAFKELGALTILNEAFTLVGMLAAIFLAKSALIFFALWVIANLDNLLFYGYAKRLQTNHLVDTELMSHAIHQSKLDILLTVASRLDGIVVFHFLGAVPLALYAFAVLTADQMKTLASVFYTIAGPKLANNPLDQILKTFGRKMLLMGVLGVAASAAYYAVAPLVYRLLFPAYISAVGYSRLYAATLIFSLPSLLGAYLLNVQDLKREASVYNIANQSVLIVLLVGGGITYGIWGIIWARLLSSMFQLGIIVLILEKKKRS